MAGASVATGRSGAIAETRRHSAVHRLPRVLRVSAVKFLRLIDSPICAPQSAPHITAVPRHQHGSCTVLIAGDLTERLPSYCNNRHALKPISNTWCRCCRRRYCLHSAAFYRIKHIQVRLLDWRSAGSCTGTYHVPCAMYSVSAMRAGASTPRPRHPRGSATTPRTSETTLTPPLKPH